MDQKTRAIVAFFLLFWTATSMYLVWYTKYEIIGIIGFLVLAAMKVYFKTQQPARGTV